MDGIEFLPLFGLQDSRSREKDDVVRLSGKGSPVAVVERQVNCVEILAPEPVPQRRVVRVERDRNLTQITRQRT